MACHVSASWEAPQHIEKHHRCDDLCGAQLAQQPCGLTGPWKRLFGCPREQECCDTLEMSRIQRAYMRGVVETAGPVATGVTAFYPGYRGGAGYPSGRATINRLESTFLSNKRRSPKLGGRTQNMHYTCVAQTINYLWLSASKARRQLDQQLPALVAVPRSMSVLCRRRWISKFGSGGPAWDKRCDPTLPPREYNREALFNVYEVRCTQTSLARGRQHMDHHLRHFLES